VQSEMFFIFLLLF